MTELEIMKRAKMYVDSLAQGIDPLSGERVQDDDIINNIRISRCLFYVSGVLGKVIDNGGEVQKKKSKSSGKLPFSLTEEQLSVLSPMEETVNITAIVKDINTLIDESTMKRIKTTDITEWLLQSGFLEPFIYNEKKYKRPTEEGFSLGISSEERHGQYGDYIIVQYNTNAQQFIIDNLPAIIEFAKQR